MSGAPRGDGEVQKYASIFFGSETKQNKKRKHKRAFTKATAAASLCPEEVGPVLTLPTPGTDQVTVSMSSCVFTAPAQPTYQRVIE